jgi:capsular exopolysaccharide synthesis family protein
LNLNTPEKGANLVNKNMDLRSLLLIFRKRLLFIIFVPLLCGLLAALVSKFLLTPVYEAKSLLMVTVASEKLPQATLNTQIRPGTDAGAVPMPVLTMNTYLEHLRSEDVMNRVLININIPELTPGKLNRMINARIVKDSNLIEVKVQNSDPILAAQIANAVSHQYMQLMEELQFSSIMVLSSANIPTAPVKPLKTLNVAMAILFGAIVSLITALVLEYLDNTLKTPEDVNRLVDQTVLAVIPKKDGQKNTKKSNGIALITFEDPKSVISEAYRDFRTNLGFLGLDQPFQTVLVTSPLAEDGKSTVAANLAIVAAQAGFKVILVDCDLRKPVIHSIFKVPNNKGFTECIFSDTDPMDASHSMAVINLSVMTSGKIPPNPAEILGSERARRLWTKLKTRYDYIIIDSPPLLAVTDASILASQVDAAVLVVSSGITRRDLALQAIEKLTRAKSRLLGVVLNQMKIDKDSYYGSYY